MDGPGERGRPLPFPLVECAEITVLADHGTRDRAPGQVMEHHPVLAGVHDGARGEGDVLAHKFLFRGEVSERPDRPGVESGGRVVEDQSPACVDVAFRDPSGRQQSRAIRSGQRRESAECTARIEIPVLWHGLLLRATVRIAVLRVSERYDGL